MPAESQPPTSRGEHDRAGLAGRIAATVGARDAAALAQTLVENVGDVADYEGSVRGSTDGPPRAGRMMIERAAPELFPAIAAALGLVLPETAQRWMDSARREKVPLIAGWDLRGGGSQRCLKLYVNASDAGHDARARLRAALLPELASAGAEPAVLGMNVRADGSVETKVYVQSADVIELADALAEHARRLAADARRERADAGAVLSFDVHEGVLTPRAFFVALREPDDRRWWRCARALPGCNVGTIDSLLPFAPAAPRSIGVSLSGDAWTLYFKPRASRRAPEALEPSAVFRAGEAEVGVFVEPTEHAARAFRRTDLHAVSIRIRNGEPQRAALEHLVDWFVARLRIAEAHGADVAGCLGDPPPPWRVVDPAAHAHAPEGRP
jgi:hypothetical protein